MANRLDISDEEWQTIYPILAVHPHVRMASEAACRAFRVAVLWVRRSGAPWRLWPAEHGQWNSVFKHCARWCRYGASKAPHTGCAHLHDLQSIIIDSTVSSVPIPGRRGAAPRRKRGAASAPSSTPTPTPWAIPSTWC